jgi:hypothetical protein
LLGSSAGLLDTALSHPCFAAAATEEFVLPPAELEVLPAVELELGAEVLPPVELELCAEVLLPAALELGVELLLLLLLLLPQPVSTALPVTTSANKTMTFVRMYQSLRSK